MAHAAYISLWVLHPLDARSPLRVTGHLIQSPLGVVFVGLYYG